MVDVKRNFACSDAAAASASQSTVKGAGVSHQSCSRGHVERFDDLEPFSSVSFETAKRRRFSFFANQLLVAFSGKVSLAEISRRVDGVDKRECGLSKQWRTGFSLSSH